MQPGGDLEANWHATTRKGEHHDVGSIHVPLQSIGEELPCVLSSSERSGGNHIHELSALLPARARAWRLASPRSRWDVTLYFGARTSSRVMEVGSELPSQ